VRDLYLKFIKNFPEYSYLARKMYRGTFNQEVIPEDMVGDIIKEVIKEVLITHTMEAEKIILFGSRARGEQRGDSDWDILLVVKQDINREAKKELFKEITERLSNYLIHCDVIIKSIRELEFYKDFYGTATYEALREGRAL